MHVITKKLINDLCDLIDTQTTLLYGLTKYSTLLFLPLVEVENLYEVIIFILHSFLCFLEY
jgi:hypothetical protein